MITRWGKTATLALLLAVVLTAPVLADAPSEPSPAQIRRIAETCTAQGAFGVRFSTFSGHSPRSAAPEWAPFQVLLVRPNVETKQVFEVAAMASFEKALMSNEDRIALATWVFHALDGEIQSRRRFAQREARPNGVTYHFAAGFTLDLSHDGVVVHIACAKT